MQPSYWVLIVIAAAGWASGGIATRAAFNQGVGPWTMVGMRVLFATIVLVGIFLARRARLPSRTVLGYGVVQAVFNLAIPYVLFTFAYDEASAGFVGLLAALIPMSTAVFANYVLPDEPLTKGKVLGLFVAFTGVAFLLLSGDSGLSEGGRPLLAAGLGLTAIVSVGFAGTFAKRHSGEYEPYTITLLQFGLTAPFLLVAMFAIEGAPTDVSGAGWALIVEMALGAAVLPFLIFYWLIVRISATNASLVGYLVPLMVLTAGIILLGEQLQFGIIVGGLLVFAGLVLSDREARRLQQDMIPVVAPTIE